MVAKAVEVGVCASHKVEESLLFSILQFADDTILLGKTTFENIWSIKAILVFNLSRAYKEFPQWRL